MLLSGFLTWTEQWNLEAGGKRRWEGVPLGPCLGLSAAGCGQGWARMLMAGPRSSWLLWVAGHATSPLRSRLLANLGSASSVQVQTLNTPACELRAGDAP